MRLALYQPEIPQNTGTLLRLAACLEIGMDIIEPCGFVFSDRRMRRAGMDYVDYVDLVRHSDWPEFRRSTSSQRLVLLSTTGTTAYTDFTFHQDDIILVGRESTGVPEDVFQDTDAQLHIPMNPKCRSLNVAIAAAMVLGEAQRQTG